MRPSDEGPVATDGHTLDASICPRNRCKRRQTGCLQDLYAAVPCSYPKDCPVPSCCCCSNKSRALQHRQLQCSSRYTERSSSREQTTTTIFLSCNKHPTPQSKTAAICHRFQLSHFTLKPKTAAGAAAAAAAGSGGSHAVASLLLLLLLLLRLLLRLEAVESVSLIDTDEITARRMPGPRPPFFSVR